MQAQSTERSRDGIVLVRGYGLKIHVDRGHLTVHDGIGRQRHTRRFHRVGREITRLIVLGHSGYITLEATRWLRDVGAAFVQLDIDGKLVATSGFVGPDLPALRRTQALARAGQAGLQIARDLLPPRFPASERC